jgi:hypothetical protein
MKKTNYKKLLPAVALLCSLGMMQQGIAAATDKVQSKDVPSTPNQYTPYFQTSSLWGMLDPHGSDLQDLNKNYLGNRYGLTSMYAGMFLEYNATSNFSCSLNEVTAANGAFNPLNDPYGGAANPNWLGQFHGQVSLVIGGDPGTPPAGTPVTMKDFMDVCGAPGFANIVSEIVQQFNAAGSSQQAHLTGLVFDVENASFHDGSAWEKIGAAIDQNPGLEIIIAIPFNTSYWNDAWSQATFATFFQKYSTKITEVNILNNDAASYTPDLTQLKKYMTDAYDNLYFKGKGIPASKISMMLDTSLTTLTPEILGDIQTWLSTEKYKGAPVNQGIHLFSREKDNRNLLSALIPGVQPVAP